ncbi:Myb119 [Dorcoceras hygrometricum]|uniref:Myb119 n=1 Tax=Dorcoceras hygrometricum TaxID=472368 RepID=A0A2Z7DIM6_9LAMI|nr:Myb119 [Dorcoceras hygrometricum]
MPGCWFLRCGDVGELGDDGAISVGLKVNWGHILFQTLVAMEQIEGISRIVQNLEETETVNSQEHQAQEEEHHAQKDEHHAQEEERPAQADEQHAEEEPAQDKEQSIEQQAQAGSPRQVQMVRYTADTNNNSEEDEDDSAQAGPKPISFLAPDNFDAVAELKRAFYKKMNKVVTNVNTSQTALETILVLQFREHQQQIASDLDFVKMQLADG